MRWLLDTNTCTYVLQGRPAVLAHLQRALPTDLAVSTITLAEAWTGCLKSASPQRLRTAWDHLVGPWAIVAFDEVAAEHYAVVRADLEGRGRMIGGNGCQIAAIALAHGLTVVTHDADEFRRVPGLRVEDWLAS